MLSDSRRVPEFADGFSADPVPLSQVCQRVRPRLSTGEPC